MLQALSQLAHGDAAWFAAAVRREFGEDAVLEVFDIHEHTKDWPTTEADLDAIVASYDPDYVKAPLKIGHSTADTDPAYGVVHQIWREGGKLYARMKNVAREVRDLVRAGRYMSLSVELFPPNHEFFSKTSRLAGQPYFAGLALLGAARPEVKGLAPVTLSEDACLPTAEAVLFTFAPTRALIFDESDTDSTEEEHVMPPDTDEKTQVEKPQSSARDDAREVAFAETIAAKDREIEGLKEQVAQFAEREQERAQAERTQRIEATIADLEETGKVSPAQREGLAALFSEITDEQMGGLVATLQAGPDVVPFGEFDVAPPPAGEGTAFSEALLADARKRAGTA